MTLHNVISVELERGLLKCTGGQTGQVLDKRLERYGDESELVESTAAKGKEVRIAPLPITGRILRHFVTGRSDLHGLKHNQSESDLGTGVQRARADGTCPESTLRRSAWAVLFRAWSGSLRGRACTVCIIGTALSVAPSTLSGPPVAALDAAAAAVGLAVASVLLSTN